FPAELATSFALGAGFLTLPSFINPMQPAQPRGGEQSDADDVQRDRDRQAPGVDLQFEPAVAVGPRHERDHRLRPPGARECPAAVGPPPRAGVLVDGDLLARCDLEDEAVGTPEDRPDHAPGRPGLALIVRILARPTERGSIAIVSQHGLVPPDHSIAPQDARIAQAVPDIDDVPDGRTRKPSRLSPEAEGQRELLVPEGDEIDGDDDGRED